MTASYEDLLDALDFWRRADRAAKKFAAIVTDDPVAAAEWLIRTAESDSAERRAIVEEHYENAEQTDLESIDAALDARIQGNDDGALAALDRVIAAAAERLMLRRAKNATR